MRRVFLHIILSAVAISYAVLASAGDLYKWQDKDGFWHFSDRPPESGQAFEFVALPTEPRPMVSMRKSGTKHEPSFWFFNGYEGPAELEIRLKLAENVRAEPALPTRIVMPANAERRLLTLKADNPRESFMYQLAYTLIPGPPLQRLPEDQDFFPPFPAGRDFPISQGFDGDSTHTDAANRYAVDIVMPIGTPVLAARSGIVMELEDDFHGGKQKQRYLVRVNQIRILHEDGSMAVYAHLQPNSGKVYPGAKVTAGTWLANSGNTGFSSGPHLHFVVQLNVGMALESLPFRFRLPHGGTMIPGGVGMISGVLSNP